MFPSTIALYECFFIRGTRTTAPNRINDSCCGVCVTARLQAVAGNGDLMSYKWRNDLNYIYMQQYAPALVRSGFYPVAHISLALRANCEL